MVELIAVKEIFPLPEAGKFVLILSFDHAYAVVPPVKLVVKLTAVKALSQTVILLTVLTKPDGFTVMVKLIAVPVQVTELYS